MQRIFSFLFLIGCMALFAQCKQAATKQNVSFYHWKMIADNDNSLLKNYSFQNAYLHIMDVMWDESINNARPRTTLNINPSNQVFTFPIIPVIYVDQSVFTHIANDSLPLLAERISSSVSALQIGVGIDSIKELQIDCDWLKSNKEKYFTFLSFLKKKNPTLTLSATIRLYPYKYPDIMGVPPVDYGVLMCYNMGNIKEAKTHNSILENKVLLQYLNAKPYPIQLKPAIPLFGWYAWFRNDSYQSLIYLPDSFSQNPLLQNIKSNNFRVLSDTLIDGHYFRNGDVLRNEFPSIQELKETIQILNQTFPNANEIIIYHWDNTNTLNTYEKLLQETLVGSANLVTD